MSALIERFEREYQEFHGLTAPRRRQQLRILGLFEEAVGGDLSEATAQDFQQFMVWLMHDYSDPPLHVNTVRFYGNMIRPFFTWMRDAHIISADTLYDARKVPNPKGSSGRGVPRPYKRPEIITFWQQFDARWPRMESVREKRMIERCQKGQSKWYSGKNGMYTHLMRCQIEAIIRLALDCGLRRNEIFMALPRDLHPDNEYIVVQHGKGGKVREVPFTQAAREAVGHWLYLRTAIGVKCDETWVSVHGRSWLKPMWRTRYNELPGMGWELHRFRHTCGTEWLRAGLDLHLTQKLLGHSNVSQTLAYAEIVRDDIGAGMDRAARRFEQRVGPVAA